MLVHEHGPQTAASLHSRSCARSETRQGCFSLRPGYRCPPLGTDTLSCWADLEASFLDFRRHTDLTLTHPTNVEQELASGVERSGLPGQATREDHVSWSRLIWAGDLFIPTHVTRELVVESRQASFRQGAAARGGAA